MQTPVPSGALPSRFAAEPQESDAIALAQRGDAAGFERLYALHNRRVYSLCLRMMGNIAEAEDLTQEAFLQMFRKIKTFRGESAFSTWLYRLTVNIVLMRLRKKTVKLTSLEPSDVFEREDYTPKEIAERDLRLAGVIDRMRLREVVDRLPPGYRLVFFLHDVQGYEHNEIATLLGCSIGNSKSQLHKARLRLRALLTAPDRRESGRVPTSVNRLPSVRDRLVPLMSRVAGHGRRSRRLSTFTPEAHARA